MSPAIREIDPDTLRIIAAAVERQGGDYSDLEDLAESWVRVQRRGEERVKVIEREVREVQAEYAKERNS